MSIIPVNEPLDVFYKIDPLYKCSVISRENRFVFIIDCAGKRLRSHSNNTGRLLEFIQPGRIALTTDKKPGKTDVRLIGFDDSHIIDNAEYSGAIIDTRLQMNCFEQAWKRGLLPFLNDWEFAGREKRLYESQLDFLGIHKNNPDRLLYIELKSAVEREAGDFGMYPDCPSLRGQRHVRHLIQNVINGGDSMIVFVSALPGVKGFTPNRNKDPEMGNLLDVANANDVAIHAIAIALDITTGLVKLMSVSLPVKL